MANDGSSVGPRDQRFDAGEGPQTLAQLQAKGAEGFSDSVEAEKGALELGEENTQETK